MVKRLFILLLMCIATLMIAQTVAPKKCNICGKPLAQCQYKGKHPQQSSSTGVGEPKKQSSDTNASYSNGVLSVKGITYNMVYVSGGTFNMGATSEQGSDADYDAKPVHSVTLRGFNIGKTEVTQELWQAVMGSNPSHFNGSRRPVESVSWNDCQTFISKLNSLIGKRFRLPTEAEWEFAARGGNYSRSYKYSGSNNLSDVAWYDGNSGSETHNVGLKSPNELGLYDMSGNVWEWCSDWYGSYNNGLQTNPKGPNSGAHRVFRGGRWNGSAGDCRSSCRNRFMPHHSDYRLGLRLALSE